MRVTISVPNWSSARTGNVVTGERWARLLTELGHTVEITDGIPDAESDAAVPWVVLHARRSAAVLDAAPPDRSVILILTGTDIYGDYPGDPVVERSLRRADRIVVLQEDARERLRADLRPKCRVIHQSVSLPQDLRREPTTGFGIVVVGHLRSVKDPFRAVEAVRDLEGDWRVGQVGASVEAGFDELAREWEAREPRYHWSGELPPMECWQAIAASQVVVVSSLMEGGANVIAEAATLGVPVLASRVGGNVGMLGADHPGYFPVGDTAALTGLLRRTRDESGFADALRHASRSRAPLFEPGRERARIASLIAGLPATPSRS